MSDEYQFGLAGITDDLAVIVKQGPAVAAQLASIIRTLNPYVGTVKSIVADPALPAVVQRISVIASMESASAGSSTAGVGLDKAVPVLDAYIYVKRNPWVPWAVGLGIVALIGGIGYRMGQRKAAT